MKVLLVGASGMVGSEALRQCLAHDAVTRVVAFVRRPLDDTNSSGEVRASPKLECVTVPDFGAGDGACWSADLLRRHGDAVGMIWAMGTYNGSVGADLEYPMCFLERMGRFLEDKEDEQQRPRRRFNYVHLSGKFCTQDQDARLWWMESTRKTKGLLETRALSYASSHASVLRTFIVKPGGIVPSQRGGFMGKITALGTVLGENWSVTAEELGAFMVHLATLGHVDGGRRDEELVVEEEEERREDAVTENARIVRKGREILAARPRS